MVQALDCVNGCDTIVVERGNSEKDGSALCHDIMEDV
jgi:hypothetical protein